jgi:phosphatidylglycerophosphatase A
MSTPPPADPTGAPPAAVAGAEPAQRAPAATVNVTPAAAPRVRPDRRFLFAHPWHFVALGGGSGLPRFAPGTWGTFAAWVSFVLLDPLLTDLGWLGLILMGLYFGAWAAHHTGQHLGRVDDSHIVIDEIVAFWIVLLLLPRDSAYPGALQTAAFLLFRLFDIVKPPPIRWFDARYKHGLGVMLDDLLAAFYTLFVIALYYRLA